MATSSLAKDVRKQGKEGKNAEPTGGYDLSFVDDVDDDLKCVVCLDVMRDPYQTVPCGHRFCKTCLDQLIRPTNTEYGRNRPIPKCPIDRDEISSDRTFPDNSCRRKIMGLKVLCKYSSLGCGWRSSLSGLEDHIAKTCLYVESSCSFEGCKSLFLKRHKEDHEANCRWRIVKCDFCSDDFRAFELVEHINTLCPSKPVPCPNNGCQKVIQRKLVQHHIDKECLLTPKSCPVEFLGCQEKGTRSSVNKHIVDNAYNHIELLCKGLKYVEVKMIESQQMNKALEQQLESKDITLKAEMAESQKVIKSMDGRLIEYGKVNKALERQLESNDITLKSMKVTMAESQEVINSMNLRMESKNKEFAALQEKVKEQEVRLNPTRLYSQTKEKGKFENELLFIWPILLPVDDHYDGFDAISPTYSTGSHGYFFHFNLKLVKFEAMLPGILPSFQLLPGPYDSLLPWPFRCKFSLYGIIGSSGQRALLAEYDGKDDPEKRACFQKPPEDGNPWYSMPECSWFNIKIFLSNNMIVAIESYSAEER